MVKGFGGGLVWFDWRWRAQGGCWCGKCGDLVGFG